MQAEMTSCGLHVGDLPGVGMYPAICCCHLTNGHMPHTANQKRTGIPMITHRDGERFVGCARAGTELLYRYLDLSGTSQISVTARGKGTMRVCTDAGEQGSLRFTESDWYMSELPLSGRRHDTLRITVTEGTLDILSYTLI